MAIATPAAYSSQMYKSIGSGGGAEMMKRESISELSDYFRSLRLDRDVSESCSSTSRTSPSSRNKTPSASITDDFLHHITTQAGCQHLVPRPPSEPSPVRPFKGGAAAGAQRILSPQLDDTKTQSLLALPTPEHRLRNLLVLDLDETLVHSSSCRRNFDPTNPNDLILRIPLDGKTCEVFVKLRPFLREFLQAVGEMFEVVIFTASLSKYASPLVDLLDPEGKLCHHRLFREHCTYFEGSYVKDLTLLGRPLNKVVIVDNSPAAYLYQPRNAIPCTTWFDDGADTELIQFLPFLQLLSVAEDVYPILDAYHELLQQHGSP